MYELISKLLEDKKGGEIFTCFSVWHIAFMLIVLGEIIFIALALKNKTQQFKNKALNALSGVAFGLYILDFFLMPFAYGEIDVEKLPFHACTLMCILCFLSRRSAFLEKFKKQFTIIGLISNIIYVLYPAGVMWYSVHPLSYRALQTLFFHGSMTVYCILALIFDSDIELKWKKIYQELVLLIIMAGWSMLGNTLYSGTYRSYSREHNWFFTKSDPFGMFPKAAAPFLTIAAFMLVNVLIHIIYINAKNTKKSE